MKLLELFQEAEKKLKKPVIEIPYGEGTRIRFSLAAKRLQENFPNYLYITLWRGRNELTYLGKITKKGEVYFSQQADHVIKSVVEQVYTDPVNFLAETGKHNGVCCFCSRILMNKESVEKGYGPICAEKYGLPWGV